MILSVMGDQDEADVYRKLKARGSVDGLIVHGPEVNDKRIELLNEIGLPYLVHGRASGVTAPYSWLDVNNRSAFKRATDFLLDLGHKKIALINGLGGRWISPFAGEMDMSNPCVRGGSNPTPN